MIIFGSFYLKRFIFRRSVSCTQIRQRFFHLSPKPLFPTDDDKYLGKYVPPSERKRKEPPPIWRPSVYRWFDAFDKKVGHWKILRPFYDSDILEREESSKWQILYKDRVTTRGAMSRGLWTGYGTAILMAIGLATNAYGYGTACLNQPIECVLTIAAFLSFAGYFSLTATTFVAAIHVTPKQTPIRPGKPYDSQYVLTTVDPLSGMTRKSVFTMNDVRVLNNETIRRLSLWKRIWQKIDMRQCNFLIGDRRVLLDIDSFYDGAFYEKLVEAGERKVSRKKSTR